MLLIFFLEFKLFSALFLSEKIYTGIQSYQISYQTSIVLIIQLIIVVQKILL